MGERRLRLEGERRIRSERDLGLARPGSRPIVTWVAHCVWPASHAVVTCVTRRRDLGRALCAACVACWFVHSARPGSRGGGLPGSHTMVVCLAHRFQSRSSLFLFLFFFFFSDVLFWLGWVPLVVSVKKLEIEFLTLDFHVALKLEMLVTDIVWKSKLLTI